MVLAFYWNLCNSLLRYVKICPEVHVQSLHLKQSVLTFRAFSLLRENSIADHARNFSHKRTDSLLTYILQFVSFLSRHKISSYLSRGLKPTNWLFATLSLYINILDGGRHRFRCFFVQFSVDLPFCWLSFD